MECYSCENEATRQCRRCARVYCEVHGGEYCAECLNPASALPSFNLYRGSLLALLIGTAVAVWLLVRPPGPGASGVAEIEFIDVTPTRIFTEVPSTVTILSPTPGTETVTPEADETAEPAASETPEPRTYTVESGDTLTGIAEAFAPPGVDANEYADDIASANNLTGDLITPGDTLILP